MKRQTGKPLRFTRLALANWRNFLSVDVELPGRAFLVGPNAAGKSNLLDALRFLHDIVTVGGGFQAAVERRDGVSRLRCLSARQQPAISVRVCLGDDEVPSQWEYELSFTEDKRTGPVIRRERVSRGGQEILLRPTDEDRSDPKRLTQTFLEQVNTNLEFRSIAELFASIRYLHILPQIVRDPDRFPGRPNDPFGADFLEQIATTAKPTREARLRRIQEALRVAVPQLRELELWRDDRGAPHVRGKYEHWRPQGAWQTEAQFSDGTLRLMGLLWAALDNSGPLLLEEPELSLHPEVVRFIPQMFARLQRRTGRQVLVSTHSSDLLRDEGIGLDEVLLLRPGQEGTEVTAGGALADVRALLEGGLSMAEAVLPKTRPQRAEQLPLLLD